MSVQFRTLLDMVDTAISRSAISQAMRSFAAENGFSHYAFLDLQGTDAQYLGDYPEDWQRLYLSDSLCRLDPVVAQARRSSGAFFWSAREWFAMPGAKRQRFAENAIEHGIAHGLTISARASFDRQLLLSFATSSGNFYKPSQADLSDAVPALMGLHYRLGHIGGKPRILREAHLSSRELLCLTWAARGKTAVETGIITGLSNRTVQHYLDAARQKLDATTLPHLVAISKDIELI